jgi:hypothetical protein
VSPKNHACLVAVAAAIVAACGGDPGGPNPGPSLNCAQVQPTTLAVGALTIIDPTAQGACVAVPSVPSAGAAGAEHLYLIVSTAGAEVTGGITAPYSISGSSAGAVTSVTELPSPLVSAFKPPLSATRFHQMLRDREQALASDPARQLFGARERRMLSTAAAAPPIEGSSKSFNVCATTDCYAFVSVIGTARVVDGNVAIYLDNATSNNPRYDPLLGRGYSEAELREVARIFNDYLYPFDRLNFGTESDLDNNGVVQVLLTPRINDLSGNCNDSESVILGYFFAVDLLDPNDPRNEGSNGGEVFYSLVPDPAAVTFGGSCSIPKDFASDNLAPTFVHEFQHMINYYQHALVPGRDGDSEVTWLNEGLSHYAEELAGRVIDELEGGGSGAIYTQYALSNYLNAYDYLSNPEATFLISPAGTGGSLKERGAGWLFVRWAADQFGTSAENLAEFRVRGTDFTRSLVQTDLNGSVNVQAQAGESFATLVTQWQLANYLEDLPGFNPSSDRLRYITINLRQQFASLNDQDPSSFAREYPLAPDSTKTGSYTRVGTLRQGSGRHVRIIQSAGAAGVQFLLSNTSGGAVSANAVPRVGLVRVR